MTRSIFRIILLLYSLVLIYGWFLLPGRMHATNGEQRVFLYPFQTTISMTTEVIHAKKDQGHLWRTLIWNVVGNIVWFIPLGFLLPWEWKLVRKARNLAGAAFLLSLSAETLQYIFEVGVFDIDDMIWNTLGALLGLSLLKKYFPSENAPKENQSEY